MTRRPAPTQLLLRLLVVTGVVVALLATGPAGDWPSWWAAGVVVVLAVGFAMAPESPFGPAAMVTTVAWWAVAELDGLPVEALVAAAGLVTAQVAATVASYAPVSVPVDRDVARLWLGRGALVLLAAPLVWAAASLVQDQPEPVGVWVGGVLAALGAVAVAGVSLVGTRGDAPE